MDFLLRRLIENDQCIQGVLNGSHSCCFTLELPRLYQGRANVASKTCVPAGTYEIRRKFSPHFNRMMPALWEVPFRTDIEIHWGNTAADIRGCILVGETRVSYYALGESVAAFDELETDLDACWAYGETIRLEIVDIPSLTELPAAA